MCVHREYEFVRNGFPPTGYPSYAHCDRHVFSDCVSLPLFWILYLLDIPWYAESESESEAW